jgi:hypothetical protein
MARTKVAPVIERIMSQPAPAVPVVFPHLVIQATEELPYLREEIRVFGAYAERVVNGLRDQVQGLQSQGDVRGAEIGDLTQRLAEKEQLNHELQRQVLDAMAELKALVAQRPAPMAPQPPRTPQPPTPRTPADPNRPYAGASPTLPPTAEQKRTLELLGQPVPDTSAEASKLIASLDRSGLPPTQKQADAIRRLLQDPTAAIPPTRGAASDLIQRLKLEREQPAA